MDTDSRERPVGSTRTPLAKFVFRDSRKRMEELVALAEKERRTRTSLLQEAIDLLFASREKEKAA